jgi:nitric oxide reductase NorD protein
MSDPVQPMSFPPFLTEFCAREMDGPSRRTLFDAIAALAPSKRSTLLELLEELIETSPRSAAVGIPRLARVLATLEPAHSLSWLDLGTSMASQSSTAAQKYFLESPDLLAAADPAKRPHFLRLGLELSDGYHGVVMDLLRAGPQLPPGVEEADLAPWMEAGLRLAEEDSVLAVEYFRISPEVLRHIPVDDLPLWVQLGRHLVEPNVFGKPDYLKVIEYFRLSSETLSGIDPADLRRPFLELGLVLARHSAAIGMDFLRSGPPSLREVDTPAQRRLVLSQARRLADAAEDDPSVVLDYLRQGSKMFRLLENDPTDFIAWVDAGIGLLTRNSERGKAYFSGRSKSGIDTTERLLGGISLKTIGRTLTLYAEGLSGRAVTIRPTSDLPENLRETIGDSPTTDGRTIYLPERIRLFPRDEDNFMLYKVTTLHEAGHLEFGTYDPDLESIRDVIETVETEYGRPSASARFIRTPADFFGLFPNPSWARSLWTILEDARIDFRLRTEYPGVRRDMDQIVGLDLQSRPKLEGLLPRAAVHEALLQLSITDTTEVPLELAETVSGAYDLLLEMKDASATSTDALRVLARLYRFLEEQLRRFPSVRGEADPLGARKTSPDSSFEPEPNRDQIGSSPSPSTLSYRGVMHPDWIRSRPDEAEEAMVSIDPDRLDAGSAEPTPRPEPREKAMRDGRAEAVAHELSADSGTQAGSTRPLKLDSSESLVFYYDEWDDGAQEYRPKWCRLHEQRIRAESGLIARETLSAYGPILRTLRRYFQGLRPEAFRRVKRQSAGDNLDLDAVIEARTELRSGRTPQDRLYIKNEKRVRDVAVAFLIDMSGSTSRQIPSARKRVIEVEQEALILLAEALQAVGDTFAVYGFSGDSKDRVDFYVIKDFSDPLNQAIHERIGAMRSLKQNRDGTAIRHTLSKLERRPEKTRLLILLSDGKPLDTGYAGTYSLQDTKMALKETRMRGIHPYCITIDKEASRYVAEMYGEVSHTIIDRVATLPERLPRIYRRLTT